MIPPIFQEEIINENIRYFDANILKALEKSKVTIPSMSEYWKMTENSGGTPTIVARFLAYTLVQLLYDNVALKGDIQTYLDVMKKIKENKDFTDYTLRVSLLICVDNDWFSAFDKGRSGVHSLWNILAENQREQDSKILNIIQHYASEKYDKTAKEFSELFEQNVSDMLVKERREIYKQFLHFRGKLDDQFGNSSHSVHKTLRLRAELWETIRTMLDLLITNNIYHYSSKSSRYNPSLIKDPEKGWMYKEPSFDELAGILKNCIQSQS